MAHCESSFRVFKKVEIICTEDQIKDAVAALIETHPYETPSYQVLRLETI